MNEEDWSGDSANDENSNGEQNDAIMEALQLIVSEFMMQYEANGSDAVTNCILLEKLWLDKDIKLLTVPEYWLNPSPDVKKYYVISTWSAYQKKMSKLNTPQEQVISSSNWTKKTEVVIVPMMKTQMVNKMMQ